MTPITLCGIASLLYERKVEAGTLCKDEGYYCGYIIQEETWYHVPREKPELLVGVYHEEGGCHDLYEEFTIEQTLSDNVEFCMWGCNFALMRDDAPFPFRQLFGWLIECGNHKHSIKDLIHPLNVFGFRDTTERERPE